MRKNQSGKKSAPSSHAQERTLPVPQQPTEASGRAAAHVMLRPDMQAAMTVFHYNRGQPELSLIGLVEELAGQCEAATKGDLSRSEALLTAQAHTLDGIFNNLARRAQGAEYVNQMEVFLRLALKAQTQCRATIEALAEIKNPRAVAFVTQANIAQGPQQVNNTAAAAASGPLMSETAPRARESGTEPTKFLEHSHGERLDTRAATPAISTDPGMEAVAVRHGSENGRR